MNLPKPVCCPACGTLAHKRKKAPGWFCYTCHQVFLVPVDPVTHETQEE